MSCSWSLSLALITVYFRESRLRARCTTPRARRDASCGRSRSAPSASSGRSRTRTAGSTTSHAKRRTRSCAPSSTRARGRPQDRGRRRRTAGIAGGAKLRDALAIWPRDYRLLKARRRSPTCRATSRPSSSRPARSDGVRALARSYERAGSSSARSRRSAPSSSRVTLLSDRYEHRRRASTSHRRARRASCAGAGRTPGSLIDRVQKRTSCVDGDYVMTAGRVSGGSVVYPRGIPVGRVDGVSQSDTDTFKQIQVQPFVDLDGLDQVVIARRDRPAADAAVTAPTLAQGRRRRLRRPFLAQLTIFAPMQIGSGTPTSCSSRVLCVALLRGSIVGAVAGFWAGLAARHGDARDARRHLAAAHARRLLDRPLRRDDRAATAPTRRSSPSRVVTILYRAREPDRSSSCSASPTSARWMLVDSLIPQLVPQPAADAARSTPCCGALFARRRAADRDRARGRAPWLTRGYGAKPRGFLPRDPRVEEPYRLTPQMALRIGILGALALAVFALLFLRLWALQVLSGDEYLRAARDNQLRQVRVAAPRGPILDRNGQLLVDNVAGHVDRASGRPTSPKGPLRASCSELAHVLDVPVADGPDRRSAAEARPARPGHDQAQRPRRQVTSSPSTRPRSRA